MDTQQILTLVSRWLHIIPAIILVGGALFMRFCLVPVIPDGTDERRESMRKRWARLVMFSTLFLLISGLYNSYYMAVTFKLSGLYLGLLMAKILLALVVFLFAAIISGRSEKAKNMREKELNWLNILCVSMVTLVMIAGYMKTMEHEKKDRSEEQSLLLEHDQLFGEECETARHWIPVHARVT